MNGTDFFVTIIAKHLVAHVSLQRTPLRSQHIFSNVLEASWCPFQKMLVLGGVSNSEQSGWRRRCPQTHDPIGQNSNENPPEIEMEPSATSAVQSRFGPKWFLPVRKAQIRLARHAVSGQRSRHLDCSGVDTPPTTRLFWKGHEDASRTLEKMCWLWRGVLWRLTCANKCLAIMVTKKKISPRHIWTTLYFNTKVTISMAMIFFYFITPSLHRLTSYFVLA